MALLEVRALTRRFGERIVLDTIDFDLEPGRIAVLVGPNGSGKSTLLRCVAGAERADEGEVRLDGRILDETHPDIREAVAVGLDDIDFFADLSVAEHLELLSFAHGGRDRDGVDRVITEFGLEPARDQLPATLSSGQRRRLALASCFVRPRRLLILDEPEQRLDTVGLSRLTTRLLREKEAGVAVLMASHDADLVAAVADERIEMGE